MSESIESFERYGAASCDAFKADREVSELKQELRGKEEVSLTEVYKLASLRNRLDKLKRTEYESLVDYINTITGIDLAALKIK